MVTAFISQLTAVMSQYIDYIRIICLPSHITQVSSTCSLITAVSWLINPVATLVTPVMSLLGTLNRQVEAYPDEMH